MTWNKIKTFSKTKIYIHLHKNSVTGIYMYIEANDN